MTDNPRKRISLDLSKIEPGGVSQSPPPHAVKMIAEDVGFSSREQSPAIDASTAIVKRRPGARKKGRTEALNVRVKPEIYNRISQICNEREYGYAEFIDDALRAWENQYGMRSHIKDK